MPFGACAMPYVSLRIPRRHYERLARRAAADQMWLDEWLSLGLDAPQLLGIRDRAQRRAAIRNYQLWRRIRARRARLAKD